jgi:hypothetical protein
MIAAVVVTTTFAVMYWRETRERYWILHDGVRSTARVTSEGGHDTIHYTYSAAGTSFSGRGPRDYRDERYAHVGIGGESVVWYSASHPWISTPRWPDSVLIGLPWIVVVTLVDLLFVALLLLSWTGRKPDSLERPDVQRQPMPDNNTLQRTGRASRSS